jgi:hypothetical protein
MSEDRGPDVLEPRAKLSDGTIACTSDEVGQESTIAICSPAKEGVPLNGSPLYTRRPDGKYERVDLTGKGPAKVATPAYRAGWARTFSREVN